MQEILLRFLHFHIFAFGESNSLQDILEFEEALCVSCKLKT